MNQWIVYYTEDEYPDWRFALFFSQQMLGYIQIRYDYFFSVFPVHHSSSILSAL